MQRAVEIPFSTLALNVNSRFLSETKVEIREGDRLVLQCSILNKETPNIARCADGVVLVLNFQTQRIRMTTGETTRNLIKPRISFLDVKYDVPIPFIPDDYIYPFPLLFEESMTMQDIITIFATQYFALAVPFQIASLCLPIDGITLEGVYVRDSLTKRDFLVKSYKRHHPQVQQIEVMTQFVSDQPMILDFAKRVIVFRNSVLVDPLLIYGGPKTQHTPIIKTDFKCYGPLVPSSHPFAYEKSLRNSQNAGSRREINPIANLVQLEKKPVSYFSSPELKTIKQLNINNRCLVDLIDLFCSKTTALERHVYAQRDKVLQDLKLLPQPNLDDLREKIEFSNNYQTLKDQDIEDQKELKTKSFSISDENKFETMTYDEIKNFIARVNEYQLKPIEVFWMYDALRKRAKEQIAKSKQDFNRNVALDKQFGQDVITSEAKLMRSRFSIESIANTKKEIKELRSKIEKFARLDFEKENNIQMEWLSYFFQDDTNEITQLLYMLQAKRADPSLDVVRDREVAIARGRESFAALINSRGYGRFAFEMDTFLKGRYEDELRRAWTELNALQKLLWYYLSVNGRIEPEQYVYLSLHGFADLMKSPCLPQLDLFYTLNNIL